MTLQKKRAHKRQGERRSNSDLGHQNDQQKRSSSAATSCSGQKSLDVEIEKSNSYDIPARNNDLMVKMQAKDALDGSRNDKDNDGDHTAAAGGTSKLPLSNSTSSPREENDPASLHHHNTTKKLPNNRPNFSQDNGEREKPKNPSLAKSLEKDRYSRSTPRHDCQCSVSTDGGSEMFVTAQGKNLYSKIRSSDSVGAPQLIIGANDTSKSHLLVKNV
jgi:hypothetical protein